MSLGQMRDIGAWIKSFLALIPAVITAGAGNDGVEVSGEYIDLQSAAGEGLIAHGGVIFVAWSAALADTKTLTLAFNLQDATDASGTGVADYGDAYAAAVVATGTTGGTTSRGVVELRIPELNGCRGFVRAQVTATLSATGTDTVALSAQLVVGGGADLPAVSGEQYNA